MSGRPQVVCVGSATADAIAVVERLPERDQRVAAREVRFAGGGPAATAAVALARLGVPVAFVGVVGDDRAGAEIRSGLSAEGVDVSAVETLPGSRSAASVIVVELEHNTRTIATASPSEPLVRLSPRALDLCERAAWVHADHAGYAPVTAAGLRRGGPRVSVDAGNPMPDLRLSDVALYAPTEHALFERYPGADRSQAMRAALDEGAELVVVTSGADGSSAMTRDGEAFAGPFPAEVASTLGAGDVFHGALLAALVERMPLEQALAWANAAAALSCRAIDGRSAIPTAGELREALAARCHDKERR